jgi:hypothetical protein
LPTPLLFHEKQTFSPVLGPNLPETSLDVGWNFLFSSLLLSRLLLISFDWPQQKAASWACMPEQTGAKVLHF